MRRHKPPGDALPAAAALAAVLSAVVGDVTGSRWTRTKATISSLSSAVVTFVVAKVMLAGRAFFAAATAAAAASAWPLERLGGAGGDDEDAREGGTGDRDGGDEEGSPSPRALFRICAKPSRVWMRGLIAGKRGRVSPTAFEGKTIHAQVDEEKRRAVPTKPSFLPSLG